jgi:hypothetical protein
LAFVSKQHDWSCLIKAHLVGVEVVGVLVDWQPTNTGMLDSEVDFIILLGRGVMYDLDRILHHVERIYGL